MANQLIKHITLNVDGKATTYDIPTSVGPTGPTGPIGPIGPTGHDGTSVTVTAIQYQVSNSGTTAPSTWLNTIPATSAGQYLWTKITFSNGSVAYCVSRNGNNGTNGDKGDTGDTGPTGPTGPAGPNLVGLQSGTTGWVITDVTSNTRGGILVKKSTDPTVSNLTASSKIQAANFYATSDKRLKENIEAADEKHLIKTFDSLGLKEFNFKQDQADLPLPDGKQVGLIAQELQEVAPSDLQDCFIRKGYDGYLSINENKLVYLCIAKIHELEQEIKELKDKVK